MKKLSSLSLAIGYVTTMDLWLCLWLYKYLCCEQHNVGISLCTAKAQRGGLSSVDWLRDTYTINTGQLIYTVDVVLKQVQQAFFFPRYNLFFPSSCTNIYSLMKKCSPLFRHSTAHGQRKEINFIIFHLCRLSSDTDEGRSASHEPRNEGKIVFGALINQIVYWKT